MQVGDARCEAYALCMLSVYLRFEKQYVDALSVNKRALEKTLKLGDRINSGQVFVQMAVLANVLEDYPHSGEYANEAYKFFHSLGGEYQLPFPLRLQGYAALHSRNLELARTYCVDSIKRNYALGGIHEVGVIAGWLLLAEIEYKTERTNIANTLANYIFEKHAELSLKF
ncbi:MAG: hypothetical protein RIR73_1072 [Chloroflexota bacterium]